MKKQLIILLTFISFELVAQNNIGSITGNVESTFQYLNQDSLIGADQPPEKGLLNTYANIFYTNTNGLKGGVRLESYLPRILGYPDRFSGTGIGMRYVGYENDLVDVTVGHFYEQFGSGMLFRAYEDRPLGYDNAMDGLRLKLRPYKGVNITGVYGKQRFSFTDGKVINSDGLVRGLDASIHLNETLESMSNSKLDVTLGASFVSKYQRDNRDDLILPENVGSYGVRAALRYGKFYMNGEYNIKENDPSSDNGFIYNRGHAALVNFGYSTKGFGIVLSAKSTDNMSFRSDRDKDLQDLLINFLPASNKTHTYNLVATLYPYATQLNGEVAYQAEMIYTIPKKSLIGGKYGIPIIANFSTIYQPQRNLDVAAVDSANRRPYTVSPFTLSNVKFWHDFNIQIKKKFNKKFYTTLAYYNIMINNDVVKVTENASGNIYSQIGVIEYGYKFNRKHSIRGEFQGLFVKDNKDQGNWATAVLEYTISPSWFVAVMDQFNYGNSDESQRVHYVVGTVGYIKGASRIMATYGRQRAGLFCVGGVCRFVPASNGLTLTFTQSF